MGCGESSLNDGIYTPKPEKTQKLSRILSTEQSKLQNETETPITTRFERNKKKGRLTYQQISDAYDTVGGNLERLFDRLSERISEYYMDLSAESIQAMTQHKLTQVQTKVYLSEQFLLMTLDILHVVGLKTNFEYSLDIFKNFNRSQSVLINYIKEKYPRAGNIFVPGDLMKVFPEFNMVERPENDMLRNAGICFLDANVEQIIKKLKQFFNILIDQLDSKFPLFQALLQDHVFTHTVEGKKMTFNYKIGRKLPENMAKFHEDETQELAITSPELFRMIIKWVTDMEEFLDTPEDEVNQKESFKVYTVNKDEVFFDDVTPDEFEGMNEILKSRLKQVKEPFKASIHGLLKQMDMFNINLMKILYTTQRKQKYVPKHEANVIKYAMYNTKLVSWLLAEKLITVLQNLIKVGQQFEKEEVSRKIDLIKFNVKDLFRAMVIGSKKEILIVFENLKKLEQNNRVKIIQIRNRLGTPLNDAMIIFIFKESFIICELQLILSEGQGVSQKVKNIQVLNHFLYQLVRSPYGVLSQVAVLLGYKDNKINYEDKITFENKNFSNFKICEQNHPDSIVNYKVQKKPIICSSCTQFYHPYENIFGFKSCEKCFIFQCCRCLFKDHKQMQDSQVNQKFSEELSCLISDQRTRKSNFSPLSKDITIDDIMKCFHKKKFFFKNIFKKHYQKLQPKDIHSFIKHKEYEVQQLPDIKSEYEPFFLLVQFKGENTYIRSFFWNYVIEEIESCFNPNEDFYALEKVSSSSYDFLIFFNTTINSQECKPSVVEKQLKVCIHPDFHWQNVKKLKLMAISTKLKEIVAYLILRVDFFHSNKVEGIDQEEQQIASKKQFLFASIKQARKSLPNVGMIQENFQMKNSGITTQLLNEYFTVGKQGARIKVLNVTNNKITDIQSILNECLSLQVLIVSKNFLKQINIVKPLKYLVKLVAFQNKLTKVTGFANVPVLRKLSIQFNAIKKLQPLNIKKLQQLTISQNSFQQLSWLEKSALPSLDSLFIQRCGLVDHRDGNKCYTFDFPKLRKIVYSSNPTKELTLMCPEITVVQCSSNLLCKLTISSKKIEQLNASHNTLSNLDSIIRQKIETLKKINAYSAGQLKSLPKINSQLLEYLNVESCSIEDISNLQNSNLPSLTQLILSSNLFTKFPHLNLPALKILLLEYVPLKDISEISTSSLPLIQDLQLYGQQDNVIEECPVFKFPRLKILRFSKLSFDKMAAFSTSVLPNLENFQITEGKIKDFPKLEFPKLKELTFFYPSVENFEAFNTTVFPSLQRLTLQSINLYSQPIPKSPKSLSKINAPKLTQFTIYSSNNISPQQILLSSLPLLTRIQINYTLFSTLPVLNFPNLTYLMLVSCQIGNIQGLVESKLGALEEINFMSNHIVEVPKMNFAKLKTINISYNKINDLGKFSHSHLPVLADLNIDTNQLPEFPTLKFPTLKQISLANNPMKNFKGLTRSKMNNLEYLSISNCTQLTDTEFPVVELPKVTNITIQSCNITSLVNLEKSKLPRLEALALLYLEIGELPVLRLPKLVNFSYDGDDYSGRQDRVFLTDIANISKWECPALETLTIRGTKVQMIPLMNLPSLEKLQLDFNQIRHATNIKLSPLPELNDINMSCNPYFSQVCLVPHSCLIESLNLTQCSLGSIPDQQDFKVKNLYLQKSKITSIGKFNLTQTEYLNIQQNQIPDLSLFIREVPKLQTLYMGNNKIAAIPDVQFPLLQYLYASNNCIKELALRERNFPMLQTFQACYNEIYVVSEISASMLTNIDLQGNMITKINCFRKQHNLKLSSLKLDKNQIFSIQYLPSTNYLSLSVNKLTNLTWVTNCHTENWNHVTINDNEITDIGGIFGKGTGARFQALSYLYLDNNKVKSLSCQGTLPALMYLTLMGNQVQVVDGIGLDSLPLLETLILTRNKLKKFGPNIHLKGLIKLQLNDNEQLEEIKDLKSPLLQQLTMNLCKIKNLDWLTKMSWPQLKNLYIQRNQISKLPKMSTFPKLFNFVVDNNPIQNVDAYVSGYSEQKKGPYINFTIKQDLSLQVKKKIKDQIAKVTDNYTCTNEEFLNQVNDIAQQVQQEPALLELDENGNVIEGKN